MASQEEHNKFECTAEVNKDQERYYLNVYKKHESILNDKSETFEKKVESLIEVWKSISELNFSQFDIKYVIQIIDWAKLHALNIVLTGEWRSTKECFRDSLLQCIENAQQSLANVNDAFSTRCQKLADVVKKPWEDPVLCNLIQQRDAEIGSQEIEFFCVETAYLISVRLKKLCENHCEDLALNLVTNFLRCKKQAAEQNFNLNATETQLWFIFDIYIALLFKFQDKAKILEQFEGLKLEEGVQLIKRFAKKRVKISKIWRNCHKIAIFGCRFFLSKALIKYNIELKDLLTDLLKTYLSLSNTENLLQEFVLSVRNLTNLADAEGLCIMCDNIHREAAVKLRHFVIEMYIRALTTDMNELERLKHANEDEKVKSTTSRLARTFSNLADLLNDHVKVARECILTAFSLEPTKERLHYIEELAKRSGFPVLDTGQEWKCRLHPPISSSDELAWVCPECGEWMCKPELTASLHTNTPLQEALQESDLGISEALCDDLIVCLSNPRYQILSWLLSWEDLYRLCILYLNDPEKMKNFVTELKFIDVDYSMFKHIKREPVDEYTGIEKGYEQYLDIDFVSEAETSISGDSTCHYKSMCFGSDGMGEANSALAQSKSDPDTLKSLRMFRPSLKRKKEDSDSFVLDKTVAYPPREYLLNAPQNGGNIYPFSLVGTSDKYHSTKITGEKRSDSFLTGSDVTLCVSGDLLGQSANSVFNSANLSSVTSTSFVSNIIKSSLTFGVPKFATHNPPQVTVPSNVSLGGAAADQRKMSSQNALKPPSGFPLTAQRLHNPKKSRDKLLPSARPSTQDRSRMTSPRKVSDLDALLREVVQDMDMDSTLTQSKNGVAATLPRLGGQVAEDQKQLVQVPLPIPARSLLETFLPNGISDDCKTKLQKDSSCHSSAKSSTQVQALSPSRKRKSDEGVLIPPGVPPLGLLNLKVKLAKLDLKEYKENLQRHRTKTEPESISRAPFRLKELTIPLEPLDQAILVSKLVCKIPRILIVRSKLPIFNPKSPEILDRSSREIGTECLASPKNISKETNMKQILVETTRPPTIIPLCHPVTRALPIVASSLTSRLIDPRVTCLLPHPQTVLLKETSIRREIVVLRTFFKTTPYRNARLEDKTALVLVPSQKSTTITVPDYQLISPKTSKPGILKKPLPVPFRLDSVIMVPQEKVKQVLSLASLTQDACKVTFRPEDLLSICNPDKLTVNSKSLGIPQEHQRNTQKSFSFRNAMVDYDRDNGLASIEKTDLCSTEITSSDNNLSDFYEVVEIEQDWEERVCSNVSKISAENHSNTETEVDKVERVTYRNGNNSDTIKKNVNMLDCDSNNSSRERLVVNLPTESRVCDNDELMAQIDEWLESEPQTLGSTEHESLQMTVNRASISSVIDKEFKTNFPQVSQCKNNFSVDKCLNRDVITASRPDIAVTRADLTWSKSFNISCPSSKKGHNEGVFLPMKTKFLNKQLRVNIENLNFVEYMHNYSKKLKGKMFRFTRKDDMGRMGHLKLDRFAPFLDHLQSQGYQEVDKENRNEQASVDFATKSIGQATSKFDYSPHKCRFFEKLSYDHMSIKRYYSNSRKRKHDDVPCFKLDQEKYIHKSRGRRLTLALKRLHEIFALPNVKVIVSDRLKTSDEASDEDAFKKVSPLADCNIRCKVDKFFTDSRSKRSKLNDSRENNLNNYRIHVRIYEDKFYSVVAKEAGPMDRSHGVGPLKIQIPGLNDYSEILPNNVNHVVNVVQHTVSRSPSVTGQNTQTSTQITPHIQRIGQPKTPDRKSDNFENNAEVSPASSSTDAVPITTNAQQSTLINILSSSKPGQKSSAPRGPFVNILSQQIIRPTHGSVERPATAVIKVEPQDRAEAQATKSVNTNLRIVTTTTQAGVASTSSSPAQGGTILQFICKSSSLPKFQQAFGKSNVYQRGNETVTESASTNETSSAIIGADIKKVTTSKALPANVQPISGNVIFRGQVPVGQTVSLIPPGSNTRQLFRITGSSHEQISLVKETVIQNKMSALLAAALQGKPKITEHNGEVVEEYSATRITLCRPGSVPPTTARIIKPVQVQIPTNAVRAPQPNVSSTTLEQLREFDMVYKQVKERSSNSTQVESTVQDTNQESQQQQRISFTYVNQVQKYTQLAPVVVVSSYNSMPQNVTSTNVSSQDNPSINQTSGITLPKVTVKPPKQKSIRSSVAKTSPTTVAAAICKPQQKPQEDEHTTQRIFDILAEYAEQLRNSPDLNNKPAPRRRSNPPSNPNSNAATSSPSGKKKKKKNNNSSVVSLVETDNEDLTMGSEDSSTGNVVHLSMTDEEQSQSASTTPPEPNLELTVPVAATSRPLLVTDSSSQPRNVIIADTGVNEALKMPNTAVLMPGNYIMPVSVVKGGQQIAVVSGGSKIFTTVPTRSGQNMLLFQSFVNQKKKSTVSAVKYSTLQPFTSISSQTVSTVNSQSPSVVVPSNSVTAVALGQTITLKKLEDTDKVSNSELLLAIASPTDSLNVQNKSSDASQPDSSTNVTTDLAPCSNAETIETEVVADHSVDFAITETQESIQKTIGVATSVIAARVKKGGHVSPTTGNSSKPEDRSGSVLVTTTTSNGPMLSNSEVAKYGKAEETSMSNSTKDFSHNLGKATQATPTRVFKTNAIYYAIRTKKSSNKKAETEIQKQAAIERELRLQKSLSEECEDLGVDEPSTSDLFPEADLLFDSNHSPSYEQKIQTTETKTKDHGMHLFSDDENSESLRNDLFEYMGYQAPVESGVDRRNGNGNVEMASSCDDSTLLPNCATISEVTLSSPISSIHGDSTHASSKYKYKYSNKKKSSLNKQTDGWQEEEVTSSEDTLEVLKESEISAATQEKTVVIMESTLNLEDSASPRCPVHENSLTLDAIRSPRKIVRKGCSCVNGSRSVNVCNPRKRVNSQSPVPNKKLSLSKKR
ncbi:uncharacterized protein [Euwallacea similis]|uniref:uncharacterized protein n=1 Tax=Euwallacea similis TaxID=1736056 RepID=UPI00344BD64B